MPVTNLSGLSIELGSDSNFWYLIGVKKQYTVYSLSGEPIQALVVHDGYASRFSRFGILPTDKAPQSGAADEPHDTFQGRNAVNQMRLSG